MSALPLAPEAAAVPPEPVPMPASPSLPRGSVVVVPGPMLADEAPLLQSGLQERRSLLRRATDLAEQQARSRLPLCAAALGLSVLVFAATVWLTAGWVQPPARWTGAAAAAGLGLPVLAAAWALWMRRRRREPGAGEWVAWAAVAALGLASPALGAHPAAQLHLWLWTVLASGACVLWLAPRRAVAFVLALVPALASSAAALGAAASALQLLLGVAASALLLALAAWAHRQAVGQQRRHIESTEALDRLRQERDAALRADQDKSRFLAVASHDLRQPVHALGLFATTLRRRMKSTPDEALARNLLRAVDGLERSFNALLDISKLDAGGIDPRPQTFALRDMFRRLQMHFGGQAEVAGLGLRFVTGGKSVTSDPQLLERIVGNLIQNAIKYTSQGGIVVVARTRLPWLNIEVWDTGQGIAPAELSRIFAEYYQIGRSDKDRSHGLGMGLAIVKRLCALLGHRLEVASTPGRGTMFRIGVPIGGLPGIQDELAPADTQPMEMSVARTLLVVDDEEAIREGLRVLLQEWGFQVVTAGDATQAEQAVVALEGRIDLVLSDYHLGEGANGMEVIALVRRLCGAELPAILVTGDTSQERIHDVAAGGDPVLFKPVPPNRLYETLRACLS